MVVDFGPKRKAPPALLLIGAAVAVLVLAGAGISAYLVYRSQSTAAGPTPTPDVSAKTKADLVAIDGGSFLMGRNTGPLWETPAHPVTVQQFMMDRTEVTNTEYAEFVSDAQYAAPSHWAEKKPPFGQEQWPVVNVSFDDAYAFAAWRSKRDGVSYRLPTEEEWEYAARNGERNDVYPWGSEWKNNVAVLKEISPATVGSRSEGNNRWGVVDLIGNVWEWTSSKASVYPGNSATLAPEGQDWIVVRGGCYVSDPKKPSAPVSASLREFIPPGTRAPQVGFRLVRSAPE